MALTKAQKLAADIKALKGGKSSTPAKIEKIEKIENKQPKKKDGRANNGGARNGSGREEGGTALQRRLRKQGIQKFAQEEVEIEITDPKTQKLVKVKLPRHVAAIAKLYEMGMSKDNETALEKFLNRVLGKPVQPISGGDEDDEPLRVDLGIDRLLDKAYGDDNE